MNRPPPRPRVSSKEPVTLVITTQRARSVPSAGRCGTAASRYSELSCTQSRAFDELEAIAPRSLSSPSLDRLSDSSGCPSPDTGTRAHSVAAVFHQCIDDIVYEMSQKGEN